MTDYLADSGVKVRYLRSGVDTVERGKIIRDLRLGAFGDTGGHQPAARGFGHPEVSLVAILDADKEGFLRAERSLIPDHWPRGYLNVNKAILYADRVTDSMKKPSAGRNAGVKTNHLLTQRGAGDHAAQRCQAGKGLIDGVWRKAGREALRLEQEAARHAELEEMSEKDIARESSGWRNACWNMRATWNSDRPRVRV